MWTRTSAAALLRELVGKLVVGPLALNEPTSVRPTSKDGWHFTHVWILAWVLDGTTERWGWHKGVSLVGAGSTAVDCKKLDCVTLLGAITFFHSPRNLQATSRAWIADLMAVKKAGQSLIDEIDPGPHPITQLCWMLKP